MPPEPGRESAHSSSCDLCSPLPSFPKSIVYGFDFSHPFDQAIYQLKYNRAGYIGGALAELLILKKGLELEAVAKRESLEAIIPIALTRRRQFVRGYNQSQLIAERLGAWLKLPVLGKGLVRRHFSSPQARIPEPELRMENVRGAFAAAPKQLAGRKRFLLVDDVVTTGATIAAATEALHEAGAECVCAVTVCSASKAQQREYLFSEGCAEEIQVQTF